MLLHFADLKRDLPGQVERIADFLDIQLDEGTLHRVVEHCRFDYMKEHAERAAPLGGIFGEGGAKPFIHKGTNGRWRDALTEEDCRRSEAMALERLGPACARWLAEGGPAA